MDREQRFIPIDGLEIRASAEGDGPGGIAGSAALFRTETDLGSFTEEIAEGAFDDVMDGDTRGLFNHDPNFVLGRTKSGTLELRATDDALEYEIPSLPKSRADVLEAIERGDVTGNSFAFTVAEETWIEEDEKRDKPHRIIQRVGTLYDVGPVTFPAYEETVVSARAEQRAAEARKQPEPEPDADASAARERTLKLLEG